MIFRKSVHVKRSPSDRRSSHDRRSSDTAALYYDGPERRIHRDRRRCWEERNGWQRVTKWTSTPLFPEVP